MPSAVPQNEYICIYSADTQKGNFENNGRAILCPTKCVITEKLNGSYSVSMEHPVDINGIWRNIQAFNILKVQGQLFTIMNAEPSYTGSSGKISVYAEHIFYKQNDQWIPPKKENSEGGWDDVYVSRVNVFYALSSARDESFPNERNESYFPEFDFTSDIETNAREAEKIESGKTRCDEVFTLLEDYGGELYRDNFYYSIYQRMQGALDNAFDIRVGLNLKGIKRTVDMSSFCTHFSAWDNYGNFFAVSYDGASLGNLPVPNIIARSSFFNYPAEDEYHAMDLLTQDASLYFSKHLAPKITYTISLKDVKNNPDYKEYSGIRYKVGDTGRIYDERLGGALTLKIVETKTDGITGEVLEITFGDVSGFTYESSQTPVPDFPIPYTPDPLNKVALVRLDENLDETEETQYFTDILEAASVLANGASISDRKDYAMYIQKNSGISSLQGIQFQYISLKKLYLESNITNLGYATFKNSGLVEATLPEHIDTITNSAFHMTELKSITLPDSVQIIQYSAFMDTFRMKSAILGNSVEYIGTYAFALSGIERIEIPASCTEIDTYAFEGCRDLVSITLNRGLKTIGAYAFSSCISLKNIEIPSSVTSIGENAFLDSNGTRNSITITINKPENSISGAPWGATNAEIIWTG